mmetsp:Transcript_14017/g.35110  ORF Transcript_14017/g.35110 Transcript_14017/m.35110 type:complete len:353 (+) Transcript_14017:1038-2096(+)
MTQVEIREADVTVVANKDILGLDVSVDDANRVYVLQRQCHLGGDESHLAFAELSPRQRLANGEKTATCAVLGDEVKVPLGADRSEKTQQERVIDLLQDHLLRAQALELVAPRHLRDVHALHCVQLPLPRAVRGKLGFQLRQPNGADVAAAETPHGAKDAQVQLTIRCGVQSLVQSCAVAHCVLACILHLTEHRRIQVLLARLRREHVRLAAEVRSHRNNAAGDFFLTVRGLRHSLLDSGSVQLQLAFSLPLLGGFLSLRIAVSGYASRGVHLHANEENLIVFGILPALLHDGCDVDDVPKLLAILAVICEAHAHILALFGGFPDLVHLCLVRVLALQESAVLSENLDARVPG